MGYPSLSVKANYYNFPSKEGPCSLPSYPPFFRQWLLIEAFPGCWEGRQWKHHRLFSLQSDVPVSSGRLAG